MKTIIYLIGIIWIICHLPHILAGAYFLLMLIATAMTK
jgi:hypothetical protein